MSPARFTSKPGNTAQRLTFERIKATGIYRAAASVESWAERTFRDVVFRDVALEYTGGGTAEDAEKPVRAPGLDARKLPVWGFYHRNTEDPATQLPASSPFAPRRGAGSAPASCSAAELSR